MRVSELVERVEARPSMFTSGLAGLGAMIFVGLPLHLLGDWFDANERARSFLTDISLIACVWTIWQVRYAPLEKLAAALKARGGE
jgi:hypothetical protein